MLKSLLVTMLFTTAATTLAADLPKRKAGLWEVTATTSGTAKAGQGATTVSMCIDQNPDDWLQPAKCSKQETKVERDRILFSNVCLFGKTTATSRGVVSGDFNKAYKIETSSTYVPPLAGMKEASTTTNAKWLSPCKAGQRPGDVIMPDGGTVNMNDMKKQMKQRKK
jgi:hypothetical protein